MYVITVDITAQPFTDTNYWTMAKLLEDDNKLQRLGLLIALRHGLPPPSRTVVTFWSDFPIKYLGLWY